MNAPTNDGNSLANYSTAEGWSLIFNERSSKQFKDELAAFTAANDHHDGELIYSAVFYTLEGLVNKKHKTALKEPWWKPSEEPVVNLVKAGALIAAEIDRQLKTTSKHGYLLPIAEDDDVMSVEVFKQGVKAGLFTDYDGHARAVKDGKASCWIVLPSYIQTLPADAEKVVWYNR